MSEYSKLVAWEVFNFMSIEYAKVAFDDSNIINIKGYNDSGKSAVLRALDVLFFNVKPSQQVKFIKDDCTYFRIICHFDDGMLILRDKYINGQGLYEMYKDGKLLYTTKQGTELTRINAVPEIIQKYLGLVTCDAWNVNSRSCFEQQLLVQTKGSENAKALNELLRAEELARASEMLNIDKNKLNTQIASTSSELEVYKRQVRDSDGVSEELITALREHDEALDGAENRLAIAKSHGEITQEIADIPSIPKTERMNIAQLNEIASIMEKDEAIKGIVIYPETRGIDTAQLELLATIKSAGEQIEALQDIPMTAKLDVTGLELLERIQSASANVAEVDATIQNIDNNLAVAQKKLTELGEELEKIGHKYVQCPNCGTLVDATDVVESA